MSKRARTLHNFFPISPPPAKRARQAGGQPDLSTDGDTTTALITSSSPLTSPSGFSRHTTYPFDLPNLPASLREVLNFVPATEGKVINDRDDQPDLDLLYFEPYIPKAIHRELFEFLRKELFFYRVKYTIKRGPVETLINTPRFTTVFGVDDTARFAKDGTIIDALNGKVLPATTYKCKPRPIPQCLDVLRELTQNATGCKFNFVLVNYYSTGDDSISYHSDDERFLGPEPAIASFTLGAKRDFLMKHKPTKGKHESETKPMKFPLASGDMILMRGRTQSNWLHSIPKRKTGEANLGRINITLRRAIIRGGTENYVWTASSTLRLLANAKTVSI